MSRRAERPLTHRTLFEGPGFSVSDYRCHACRGGPLPEEYVEHHTIVLLRHGVYQKHVGRESVTLDTNQAAFFTKEREYRVSHPADCGDRGTVFTPSPEALGDILGEIEPAYAERQHRPFPFLNGPCDPQTFWTHRQIVRQLESLNGLPADPLWLEESSLALMSDVLTAAFERAGSPRSKKREETIANHIDRAEAVKSNLASRVGAQICLEEIAQSVELSPFHMARIFRSHTGITVHRYRTQLRMRAALERLAAGADDLTELALDLGYSSHSHFTDTFRREFGAPPSELRRILSTNPEA